MSPEEIGYFRVTDREFWQSADALRINDEFIRLLPENGNVVEIGSGLNQGFARALKEKREDITCISIDPTLGLSENNFYTTHRTDSNGNLEEVSYTSTNNSYYNNQRPTGDWVDTIAKQEEISDIRVKTAQETGNVIAGLVPELPFASNSIDLIVDSWGPGLYLDRYKEDSPLSEYLHEVSRALKSDGQAHIYPIDFYNEALEENDIKNKNAIEEYTKILQTDPSIEFKFYEYEDKALRDGNKKRIGIIIRKR